MRSTRPGCWRARTALALLPRHGPMVDTKLAETSSPEQISGYFKVNRQPAVSHEAIYQRIYADKRAGGTLHLALRCQKARKKRYPARSD